MDLRYFEKRHDFYSALKKIFDELKVPINYVAEEPAKARDILTHTYKEDDETYSLIDDVYILGMIDDAAFQGESSIEVNKIQQDYDGIIIFGVTLKDRANNLLPTRSQLATITRAFNREFHYTPVVVVFKYDNYIALANAERQKYKQEWREGERVGKVSMLRDIDIITTHSGHIKILQDLIIDRTKINSFSSLYSHWEEVFSVSILNKRFYNELSNWYFWAIKHVTFPTQSKFIDDENKEHRAKNVIRMLTRLLFVWFIKEKKLIPEELFDLKYLENNVLKKIEPIHCEGLFREANKESVYYKAILQNLFFATLNCPIKSDNNDRRERGFRGDESYGKHRGIDYLMRYKNYFKDPDAFLELVNKTVPFLNGGLFECLDDKDNNVYIDGFSDNMTKGHQLIVPDFLFFGLEEKVDLSSDYGVNNRQTREAAVKGLINILKSYKFTIDENTPIDEDVALDPELLGKVFENLLASYNPETKTTARKQTGSFYTPREIVNYMVDESLIAHIKNAVSNWDMEEEIDKKLHLLVSFEPVNPFKDNEEQTKKIISAIDNCKILDPACGSGAFPMGILQKMVHVLKKIDPNNKHWHDLQMEKATQETKGVFKLQDKDERDQLLLNINEAFNESINNPDYARKLFLIENCIYGVDIQPVATQISKLRFFISLVVEQRVNPDADNFGIRPLPNLETKFVTANTLIGIDKKEKLFQSDEVKNKFNELKIIRHKIFGAKTKQTKIKYRNKDEELRKEIAGILIKNNLPNEVSEELARWDPFDQNASSSFYDSEWMFDVTVGFDIVIGNPPYIGFHKVPNKEYYKSRYFVANGKYDFYILFIEQGLNLLRKGGFLSYICPSYFYRRNYGKNTRELLLNTSIIRYITDFKDYQIFESALTYTCIFGVEKNNCLDSNIKILGTSLRNQESHFIKQSNLKEPIWSLEKESSNAILEKVKSKSTVTFGNITKSISQGIVTGCNDVFLISKNLVLSEKLESTYLEKAYKGRDIKGGKLIDSNFYIFYPYIKVEKGKDRCISESELKESCPNLYSYLKKFKTTLSKRDYFVKSNKQWFELWNPRKKRHFLNRKFVFPEISIKNDFALVDECFYTDSACGAELNEELRRYEKYLLLYLNSPLATYIYKKISVPKANGYSIYKNAFLKDFPIIIPSKIKDSTRFEEIGQIEFNNYIIRYIGLTEEEIKIVEKFNSSSRN